MSHDAPFLQFSGDNLYVGQFTVKPISGFTLPVNDETGKRFPECCEAHLDLRNRLRDWYNKLPNCCDKHRQEFEKRGWDKHKAFPGLVQKILTQAIQTEYFIESKIDSKEWLQEIIDYLDYNNQSFGHPNIGAEQFMNHVRHFIRDSSCIEEDAKRIVLLQVIDKKYYSTSKISSQTDLNVLHATYQKWLRLFPFDLTIFSHLKEKFHTQLPIIKKVEHVNQYSGMVSVSLHTKESLISELIDVTDKLITEINAYKLNQEGKLAEPDKLKLEYILKEREMKLSEGYKSQARDEQTRYRRILKDWLKDEKKFIEEITPLLEKTKPYDTPLSLDFENNFDNVTPSEVFKHFYNELVLSKLLSSEDLESYLKLAFEKGELPLQRWTLRNVVTKKKVTRIFYDYYKNIAGKPHGKQEDYARLLGEYFTGYKTSTVKTNFSKSTY